MTTKRKGQPKKERKKKSHGIRMYDDDHKEMITEFGSLQKFIDFSVEHIKRATQFRNTLELLDARDYL